MKIDKNKYNEGINLIAESAGIKPGDIIKACDEYKYRVNDDYSIDCTKINYNEDWEETKIDIIRIVEMLTSGYAKLVKWKPKDLEMYYFIDSRLGYREKQNTCDIDRSRIENKNCFRTEKEVIEAIEKIKCALSDY